MLGVHDNKDYVVRFERGPGDSVVQHVFFFKFCAQLGDLKIMSKLPDRVFLAGSLESHGSDLFSRLFWAS